LVSQEYSKTSGRSISRDEEKQRTPNHTTIKKSSTNIEKVVQISKVKLECLKSWRM